MNVFPSRNEESSTPLIQILSIGNRQIGKGPLLIIEQVIDNPVPPSVVLVIKRVVYQDDYTDDGYMQSAAIDVC